MFVFEARKQRVNCITGVYVIICVKVRLCNTNVYVIILCKSLIV
jgi:hypothetical protein